MKCNVVSTLVVSSGANNALSESQPATLGVLQ